MTKINLKMDFLRKIPNVNEKIICITSNKHLAATISSYFNWPGEYFCVLEAPRMGRPDAHNEIVRRLNSIMEFRPKIVLADLDLEAIEEFKTRLTTTQLVIIKESDNLEEKLSTVIKLPKLDVLKAKSLDCAIALLAAKHLRKKLILDDDAPPLSQEIVGAIPQSPHVLVIDDSREIAPVIAANYAFSVGATINTFPEPKQVEVEESYSDIYESKAHDSRDTRSSLKRSLMSQQIKYEQLFTAQKIEAKFVTFVTKGIPYGYFFPDIPSTHLFSYPDLGINILRGIRFAQKPKYTRSALVVDPGLIKDSETEVVLEKLRSMGMFVAALRNRLATVFEVEMHIQFFPYDLLYICTHAGEMEGEELLITFKDKEGKEQEMKIQQAVGFGITDEGEGDQTKVLVQQHSVFLEVNGVDWNDKEKIRATEGGKVVEEFIRIPIENWTIKARRDVVVKWSSAIELNGGSLQFSVHSIADNSHPLVFNNACISFYESAGRMIFAGARAYIGTLTYINSDKAKILAESLFESLSKSKSIPLLLWEIQRSIFDDPQDRGYVHVGVHFTNILPCFLNPDDYVLGRLAYTMHKYKQRLEEEIPSDVRDNISRAVKFIDRVGSIIADN